MTNVLRFSGQFWIKALGNPSWNTYKLGVPWPEAQDALSKPPDVCIPASLCPSLSLPLSLPLCLLICRLAFLIPALAQRWGQVAYASVGSQAHPCRRASLKSSCRSVCLSACLSVSLSLLSVSRSLFHSLCISLSLCLPSLLKAFPDPEGISAVLRTPAQIISVVTSYRYHQQELTNCFQERSGHQPSFCSESPKWSRSRL